MQDNLNVFIYITDLLCAEPSFVFADVIREGSNSPDGDDDKIYYFFTEVSVEYEFFGKLLIPRIARVCKVSSIRTHADVWNQVNRKSVSVAFWPISKAIPS